VAFSLGHEVDNALNVHNVCLHWFAMTYYLDRYTRNLLDGTTIFEETNRSMPYFRRSTCLVIIYLVPADGVIMIDAYVLNKVQTLAPARDSMHSKYRKPKSVLCLLTYLIFRQLFYKMSPRILSIVRAYISAVCTYVTRVSRGRRVCHVAAAVSLDLFYSLSRISGDLQLCFAVGRRPYLNF